MIYLELFWTFFKIGAFTFGGGYAMLPLIQEEVLAHAWLPLEDIIDFIAVSESTPGPFAINISTYVGMETGGLLGAVCATLGVVVPSFVIILIVARFYMAFSKSKIISGVMTGLKPAVIGLIACAVVNLGKSVFLPEVISLSSFLSSSFIVPICIFILTLILAFKKLNPVFIILISAGIGVASGYIGELI